MESLLSGGDDLPESLRRSARRLLREENASVLQDLVSGGACTFSQLLDRIEQFNPDEIDLIAWMRPLAELERNEAQPSVAFQPKD